MKKLLAATAVLGFVLSAQMASAASPWAWWPDPPGIKVDKCASVLVPPGFICRIDKAGNIVITEWTPPPTTLNQVEKRLQQAGRELRDLFS